MKNLYFVAHQDDELLNTGILLAQEARQFPYDTYVVLCTDGGGSGVLNVLGDGKDCWLHTGSHSYPLIRKEFSFARDREFLESCRMLGVKDENVIIHKKRGLDGSLSAEEARNIIIDVLSLFPEEKDFRIRAVSSLFVGRQNPDHRAIAVACEELFKEGMFTGMLLVTDSCFEGNCRELFPEREFIEKTADTLTFEKIKAAAECYGKWEPEKGRFAVGFHSVKDEFEEIVRNPKTVFYRTQK